MGCFNIWFWTNNLHFGLLRRVLADWAHIALGEFLEHLGMSGTCPSDHIVVVGKYFDAYVRSSPYAVFEGKFH